MCAGLLLRDGFDGLRRGDLGSEKRQERQEELGGGGVGEPVGRIYANPSFTP